MELNGNHTGAHGDDEPATMDGPRQPVLHRSKQRKRYVRRREVSDDASKTQTWYPTRLMDRSTVYLWHRLCLRGFDITWLLSRRRELRSVDFISFPLGQMLNHIFR